MLAALIADPTSSAKTHAPPGPPCFGRHITAKQARQFVGKVWRLDHWKRGVPGKLAIVGYRHKLRCAAGPGHRHAMKHRWRKAKDAFFEHRQNELWRVRVTPFCSEGVCYALPVALVICESGGNYGFTYGAYSILDPAWYAWGGKTAHAGEASKKEQDRVAHYGYSHYGEAPWECKSDGQPHPF